MLSQMNYRKETQPHGDELFPLSIHVFETDLQSTVRVYCHWHCLLYTSPSPRDS